MGTGRRWVLRFACFADTALMKSTFNISFSPKEMADDEPEKSGPDFSNLPYAFQYSARLNCLISLSKGSGLEIYDVHSRKITSRVPLLEKDEGIYINVLVFLHDFFYFAWLVYFLRNCELIQIHYYMDDHFILIIKPTMIIFILAKHSLKYQQNKVNSSPFGCPCAGLGSS